MMAGRAQGAEGIVGLAREHGIDAGRRCPDRAQCRLQRAGRHGGVGIEILEALGRRDRLHAAQVLGRMGAQDVFLASRRRLAPLEIAEMLGAEDLVHRPDAVDAFRMALGRHMAQRGGMREQQGGHGAASSRFRSGLL